MPNVFNTQGSCLAIAVIHDRGPSDACISAWRAASGVRLAHLTLLRESDVFTRAFPGAVVHAGAGINRPRRSFDVGDGGMSQPNKGTSGLARFVRQE